VGTEPPTQRTELNHNTAHGAAECPLSALAPNLDPHSVAASKLNRREWPLALNLNPHLGVGPLGRPDVVAGMVDRRE
jgi:hypothetical protein